MYTVSGSVILNEILILILYLLSAMGILILAEDKPSPKKTAACAVLFAAISAAATCILKIFCGTVFPASDPGTLGKAARIIVIAAGGIAVAGWFAGYIIGRRKEKLGIGLLAASCLMFTFCAGIPYIGVSGISAPVTSAVTGTAEKGGKTEDTVCMFTAEYGKTKVNYIVSSDPALVSETKKTQKVITDKKNQTASNVLVQKLAGNSACCFPSEVKKLSEYSGTAVPGCAGIAVMTKGDYDSVSKKTVGVEVVLYIPDDEYGKIYGPDGTYTVQPLGCSENR